MPWLRETEPPKETKPTKLKRKAQSAKRQKLLTADSRRLPQINIWPDGPDNNFPYLEELCFCLSSSPDKQKKVILCALYASAVKCPNPYLRKSALIRG